MIEEKDFLEKIEKLYDAFDKDISAAQAQIYYVKLKWLSDAQLQEVIEAAVEAYDKFPTIKQLIGICYNKSFFGRKEGEKDNYFNNFVLFQCYCKAEISLQREDVQKGFGSFRCPHTYYRKPVDEMTMLREAERELVKARNEIAAKTRPAAERDAMVDSAVKIYKQRKDDIRKLVVDAPLMCTRRYDYAFVRDQCKEHNGKIDMIEQKLKPEEMPSFEFEEEN